MRIVGGAFHGRKIPVDKKIEARPTTNFAKEGLFNILENNFHLEDCEVLELFGGSGNVTFEFLSRGVAGIFTVEQNQRCIQQLYKLKSFFSVENIRIIKADVHKFLHQQQNNQFDIIFADPPYDKDYLTAIHEQIFNKKLLKPEGWLILEHDKKRTFEKLEGFMQQRKYGNVQFSIFRNEAHN